MPGYGSTPAVNHITTPGQHRGGSRGGGGGGQGSPPPFFFWGGGGVSPTLHKEGKKRCVGARALECNTFWYLSDPRPPSLSEILYPPLTTCQITYTCYGTKKFRQWGIRWLSILDNALPNRKRDQFRKLI